MQILVVAAHQDDEVLGCGGTIAQLIKRGNNVSVFHFVSGYASRDVEIAGPSGASMCARAASVLGISRVFSHDFPDQKLDTVPFLVLVKALEVVKEQVKPDVIFTHYGKDLNLDHRIAFEAVLTATRPKGAETVKRICSFEIPSSTEWAYPLSFSPNVFFDISQTIDQKKEAMRCYETEIPPFPHPRSEHALDILAQRWGMSVGLEYAEAFQLIRDVQR